MQLTACNRSEIDKIRFQVAYLFVSKPFSCSIARNPANGSFPNPSATELEAACEGFEPPINADEYN